MAKNNIIEMLDAMDIVYAKKYNKNDEWFPVQHSHPFTEFFYVTEGEGELHVEDKTYDLKKDDFVIINSKIRHSENSIDDAEFSYIVLGVEGLAIQAFGKNFDVNIESEDTESDTLITSDYIDSYVFINNFEKYSQEAIEMLEDVEKEINSNQLYSKNIAKYLFSIFLMKMNRSVNNSMVIEKDKRGSKQLNFIKNYLENHYTQDISLDDLAGKVYISKYYLVHEFKKAFGYTPMDYLLHVRLDTAKKLLVNADYSIKKISELSGFSSQSYFNQIFKKKVGVSPSEYKRENLKQ